MCRDVNVIYIRGFKDETKGDWATRPIVDELRKKAPKLTAKTDQVFWTALPKIHEEGRRNLIRYLEKEHRDCPKEKFLIIGYSLGAKVVQDALSTLSPEIGKQICAVELFAYPKSLHAALPLYEEIKIPEVYGGTPPWKPGKPAASGRVFVACNADDPLCSGDWPDVREKTDCLDDVVKNTFVECYVSGHLPKAYEATAARNASWAASKCADAHKATGRSHMVVPGDTLWDLAAKAYGDGNKWQAIYDANRSVIERAAQGHSIFPGTVLVIPRTT